MTIKVIKLWPKDDHVCGMSATMDQDHFKALCKIGLDRSDTMYIIAYDNKLEGL